MRVLTMSDAELDKLEIIRDVDLERMPARAAAVVLGISERQVWRLLKCYRLQGAGGLISLKCGQPSNRKTPYDVRADVSLFADSADFFEDVSVNFLIALALGWSAQLRARTGMLLALVLLFPAVAFLWTAWAKFHTFTPPAPWLLSATGPWAPWQSRWAAPFCWRSSDITKAV